TASAAAARTYRQLAAGRADADRHGTGGHLRAVRGTTATVGHQSGAVPGCHPRGPPGSGVRGSGAAPAARGRSFRTDPPAATRDPRSGLTGFPASEAGEGRVGGGG